MNTMSQIINSAIAAGALVLTAIGAFAQTDQQVLDDVSRASTAMCLFSRAPVLNAPFSAEVTITGQPPARKGTEQRAVARYYRDREGVSVSSKDLSEADRLRSESSSHPTTVATSISWIRLHGRSAFGRVPWLTRWSGLGATTISCFLFPMEASSRSSTILSIRNHWVSDSCRECRQRARARRSLAMIAPSAGSHRN
jgi:hypothetical protein